MTDRIWTIPNLLSAFRIILILVFAALFAVKNDGWAIAALAVAGFTDFFDGYLARRWHQVTRLGRFLDPAADRLLTLTMVIGLPLRGIIPWWVSGVLIARDVVVGVALMVGKRRGVTAPNVTFAGKSATFGLFVFLPLAYLAFDRWAVVSAIALLGTLVSATVYWWAGLGYVREALRRPIVLRWAEDDRAAGEQ